MQTNIFVSYGALNIHISRHFEPPDQQQKCWGGGGSIAPTPASTSLTLTADNVTLCNSMSRGEQLQKLESNIKHYAPICKRTGFFFNILPRIAFLTQ